MKIAGFIAATVLVLLFLVLSLRSRPPELQTGDSSGGITAEGRGIGAARAPQVGSLSQDRGSDPVVVGGLHSEASERPKRVFSRKFRKLPARRDPQLEADPQFQKLLELDSARKMALVEHDDKEALKQETATLQDESAKISRRVLEQALVDPNAEVRLAALFELSLQMDAPPLDLLAPVVEGDPDPEVRLEALEMVGESEDEGARAVIEGALTDPDEDIRNEAEALLEARDEVP